MSFNNESINARIGDRKEVKKEMKRKMGSITLDIPDYPEYLQRQIRLYKGAEELWAKDIIAFLLRDDSTGKKRILDAGSGAGVMALALSRLTKEKEISADVVGLDLLPEMVAFSREKATKEDLMMVSFLEGDVLDMPFPDNSFDLVTATFLFFFLDENQLAKFLNEAYRVLRDGGKFYFFHPQRNRLVYALTWALTQGKKQYELDTIRHSYTPEEIQALIRQSLLADGNHFGCRPKWGPLMVQAYGTISK